MKKFLALVCAATLVLAMAVPTFAASSEIDLSGATVTASGKQNDTSPAESAIDDNISSAWRANQDGESWWLLLDLGKSYTVDKLTINWEDCYAKAFIIEISDKADTGFSQVYAGGVNNKGDADAAFTAKKGRYIKITITEKANTWGVGIFNIKVYGEAGDGGTQGGAPSSPATGVESGLVWVAVLAIAGGAFIVSRKIRT